MRRGQPQRTLRSAESGIVQTTSAQLAIHDGERGRKDLANEPFQILPHSRTSTFPLSSAPLSVLCGETI